MTALRVLYHLALADFLERTRRYTFLIIVGLTILAGYLLVPAADAPYVVGLQPYDANTYVHFRGACNSAWVGSMVAAMTVLFLSLFGFYLIKDAVERDRRTGVGEIISATPLSKLLYTLGKWLSGFTVLAAMVGILAVAALAMLLIRGEEPHVELWSLLAPFAWLALPPLALVAALAVLFDTVSWLRGGLGNVVYFFLWSGTLPWSLYGLSGMNLIAPDVMAAVARAFPGRTLSYSIGVNPASFYSRVMVFHWDGIAWPLETILGRLTWVALALVVSLAAGLLFQRFDPAHYSGRPLATGRARRTRWRREQARPTLPRAAAAEATGGTPRPRWGSLPSLSAAPLQFHFGRVLLAELRLMLKGQPWWWHAVALGFLAASLVAPLDVSRAYLLPLLWLWPLVVWSVMGVREARHRTDQLVFSAAHPLRRQLPATWLAGLVVAVLAGSGVALRLMSAGDWAGVLAWAAGALFIPSLALALGSWSGSSKLFEVVYTVLWYVGPVHQIAPLDFMGVSEEAVATGVPLRTLGFTVLLLGLAIAGRRRQLAVR